jgi:hypothetical protein
MEKELIAATLRHSAQIQLLTEAVLQLIEQALATPEHASRFEVAMRARTNALLEEADPPDQETERCLTELLAALLEAAGTPPQRG